MIWATEYKHVELVKLLLSKGSDINIRDNVSFHGALGTLSKSLLEARGARPLSSSSFWRP
jgi:ankyrin repeat protein